MKQNVICYYVCSKQIATSTLHSNSSIWLKCCVLSLENGFNNTCNNHNGNAFRIWIFKIINFDDGKKVTSVVIIFISLAHKLALFMLHVSNYNLNVIAAMKGKQMWYRKPFLCVPSHNFMRFIDRLNNDIEKETQ